MLDLTQETAISLAAATSLVPPGHGGKKTHLSTILRWITHGAKSPTGELVRLDGIRLGGRWLTSLEALQRFGERLTPVLDSENKTAEAPRTPTARRRASERAEQELGRLGF